MCMPGGLSPLLKLKKSQNDIAIGYTFNPREKEIKESAPKVRIYLPSYDIIWKSLLSF